MRKSGLMDSPLCRIPRMDSYYVMATAQVLQIKGRDILNIDLFYEGECEARYFADKEYMGWCVNIGGKWSRAEIKNAARSVKCKEMVVGGYWYCLSSEWKFASEEDEKTALDYLDTYSVNSFEEDVRLHEARNRIERKKEKIANIMAEVPLVPERAEQWLEEEIFPERYLFVSDKEKTCICHCTNCGYRFWRKKRFKQHQVTECPNCNASVKVEKSPLRFRYANIIILQVMDADTWVERQFRAEAWWRADGTREIKLNENIRAVIKKGHRWGKLYYGEINNADEYEQEWWDKNTRSKRFLNSYLYPYNLDEVLPYGGLQHTGMEILAMKNIKFNVNKMIIKFSVAPWIEYLIKSGLIRMAVEIINDYWDVPAGCRTGAGTLKDFLHIDGNRLSRLKRLDGSLTMLTWLRYERMTGKKLTDSSISYLDKQKMGVWGCTDILEVVGSANRLANYLKKQKQSAQKTLDLWRDYIRMAREEGLDTGDDIVRLPKDLKGRHDQLVEIRNTRRDMKRLEQYKKYDVDIIRRLPEMKRYFWEDERYMIIPAGKCEELMEEGRKLHHCVGASDRYMEKMAQGYSWILFLREKAKIESPYYTIEIRLSDDNIIQYYSEYDRQPDKETIRDLLNRYKEYLRRQRIEKSA